MSRNGSGTYVLPAGNPVVTGTVITSTWANTTLSDIATALTGSIASDGQTVVTGNIQMGNNRITGMADGITATDAATLGQISNANITSGTINGAVIGNVNPQAGTFTTLIAPTLATSDNSTKVATTAFVHTYVDTGENVVNSFNTRKGVVTLLSADVTTALGYTPPTPTGTGASGNWNINAASLSATLIATKGGTGLSAVGASGNILTSNGTAWVSAPSTGVPTGAILMWSGSIASIPAGWNLCDGSNGTPNLVDRFVVCAGSMYAVNAAGGSANAIVVAHTHTTVVNDPGHLHTANTYNAGQNATNGGALAGSNGSSNTSTSTTGITVGVNSSGQDGANANLPPYFALAYIMKVQS